VDRQDRHECYRFIARERPVRLGKRSGAREMTWLELVSGEAELERDLVKSLAHRKAPLSVVRGGKVPRSVGAKRRPTAEA
jgi:hypothetical protein